MLNFVTFHGKPAWRYLLELDKNYFVFLLFWDRKILLISHVMSANMYVIEDCLPI